MDKEINSVTVIFNLFVRLDFHPFLINSLAITIRREYVMKSLRFSRLSFFLLFFFYRDQKPDNNARYETFLAYRRALHAKHRIAFLFVMHNNAEPKNKGIPRIQATFFPGDKISKLHTWLSISITSSIECFAACRDPTKVNTLTRRCAYTRTRWYGTTLNRQVRRLIVSFTLITLVQ